MKQFGIFEAITATLQHSQSRKQKHGEDLVPCMDNKFECMVPNTFFDMIDPDIRKSRYERAAGGRQADLDDAEALTPKLRCAGLFEMPQTMTKEFIGYKLTLIIGTGREKSNLVAADCKVNKLRADFKDGGQVRLTFRTQHIDVDADTIGRFGVLQGNDVTLTLTPPTAAEELERAQRATTEAAKGKKPDAKAAPAGKPASTPSSGTVVDATSIFAGTAPEQGTPDVTSETPATAG
jgi:hypothetical protein